MQRHVNMITRRDGWTFTSIGQSAALEQWDVLMPMLFGSGIGRGRHYFIHFIARYWCESILENFPLDDLENCIKDNPGKEMFVIFDAHTEGPCYDNLKSTAELINVRFGIKLDRMLLWGGSVPDLVKPIRIAQNLNAFSTITNITRLQDMQEPTHHFAMLARMPKPHRILAAVGLLERGLDQFGFISCDAAGPEYYNAELYEKNVPVHLRHRFPMLLDGVVSEDKQHDMLEMWEVTKAFCQLIPETSHEWLHPAWCKVFPTEKSEKCLLMGHVPIYIAPMGHVAAMRSLGFDLFDDIVDHSYDNEQDPSLRLLKSLDSLEAICRTPLRYLIDWRNSNLDRLRSNRELCYQLRMDFWNIAFARLREALV